MGLLGEPLRKFFTTVIVVVIFNIDVIVIVIVIVIAIVIVIVIVIVMAIVIVIVIVSAIAIAIAIATIIINRRTAKQVSLIPHSRDFPNGRTKEIKPWCVSSFGLALVYSEKANAGVVDCHLL